MMVNIGQAHILSNTAEEERIPAWATKLIADENWFRDGVAKAN